MANNQCFQDLTGNQFSLFSSWRLYSRNAKRKQESGKLSDWLKLAGEKIRREQVGSVRTFLSVRANKVAKWNIGFKES